MSRRPRFRPGPMALAMVSLGFQPVLAQQSAPPGPVPAAEPASAPGVGVVELERVVVQSTPFLRQEDEIIAPTIVLSGARLDQLRAPSVGETLETQPGVTTTDFGPGVGRPVIRGQEGPRVLTLENGIGTHDVAALSADHAVVVDTGAAEQIEVLKGPGTLLYGSGAAGGVVNVINGRLPEQPLDGATGEAEARYTGNGQDRSLRANADFGDGTNRFHVDATGRKADDIRTPLGRLTNSYVESGSGAVSASRFGRWGDAGVSVSHYETDYAVPRAEEAGAIPTGLIGINSNRVMGQVHLKDPVRGIAGLEARGAVTRYGHTEFEAPGEPGTIFDNREAEMRLTALHARVGGLQGIVGGQFDTRRLSVTGEEAFLPRTRSQNAGIFWVEEYQAGFGRLEGGVRYENARYRPDAGTGYDERGFDPLSASLSALVDLGPNHHVRATAGRYQRAPASEELYAFGPHLATRSFDRGGENLRTETLNSAEVAFDRHRGPITWTLAGYYESIRRYTYQRFSDSGLDADGTCGSGACGPDGVADRVDAEGAFVDGTDELQLLTYSQADARFYGGEASATARLLNRPGQQVTLRLFGDVTRGRLSNGENLPRVTPPRAGLDLTGRQGEFDGRLTLTGVSHARYLAPLETPTAGYALLGAGLGWRPAALGGDVRLALDGTNLLDAVARRHNSFLKDDVPLRGRAVTFGVRVNF